MPRHRWHLRPVVWAFPLLLGACGARTELGGSEGPPVPCTKPPWLVFEYDAPAQSNPIWAMRADGSSLHPLDLAGVRGVSPSIAPDSASMVYLAMVSDFPQTEVLNVFDFASRTNRTLVQLTVDSDNLPGLGMAAISPDNQLVAYGIGGFDLGVHVVGFDGSNDRVLGLAPWDGWEYGRPVFSQSSSTVYASTFWGRLESIHTDGTGRTLLEDPVKSSWAGPSDFPANPSFSPDRTKLVAQISCKVTAQLRIFSLDDLPGDPCTAGTKLVEVEQTKAWDQATNAAWGPSNLIAYESGKDILLIDPAGGTPQNLTAGVTGADGVASYPTWASGCADLP